MRLGREADSARSDLAWRNRSRASIRFAQRCAPGNEITRGSPAAPVRRATPWMRRNRAAASASTPRSVGSRPASPGRRGRRPVPPGASGREEGMLQSSTHALVTATECGRPQTDQAACLVESPGIGPRSRAPRRDSARLVRRVLTPGTGAGTPTTAPRSGAAASPRARSGQASAPGGPPSCPRRTPPVSRDRTDRGRSRGIRSRA
jgi:hypothetical protein